MTGAATRPEQSEGEPPSRRGRKLGPISDTVGAAHRAWLVSVRATLLASGLTLDDLAERSGYSKSRISELLRGNNPYPRWEITHSVIHVLGIPARPMRRLWTAAAREAHKNPDWIQRCIEKVTLSVGPDTPPLDHQGFTDASREAYTEFARVFLPGDHQAAWVVAETFDILWLCWDAALASSDVSRFAWKVLRARVMARTPHTDGHPELRPSAFITVAQDQAQDTSARFAQFEESLVVFEAISCLPDNQLDVTVLRYMCGLDDTAAADILGVSLATVLSDGRHAQRALTNTLYPHPHPRGTPE